jgi:hypothetical protein
MVENKLKQFAPSLISGLVLVLTIGAVSTVNLSQSRSLLAQQDEKVELQNRIDQLSVENNTQITKVKAQANGIDVNRVENDDKVAEELMETVFTWKSYDEYNEIRNTLMNKYQLSNDSSFMQTFMPEIYNEVLDGKNYNRIDVGGYNISFNDMTSYVVSIDEKTKVYEYFTIVDVTSKSENGGSIDYSLALQYKVTDSEQIMNLNGYTID